jgi:hypothetical protein
MFLEITQASYITDFKVSLTFNNGVEMTVDLENELTGSAFTPLKDKEMFKKFAIVFNISNGKMERILHPNICTS